MGVHCSRFSYIYEKLMMAVGSLITSDDTLTNQAVKYVALPTYAA